MKLVVFITLCQADDNPEVAVVFAASTAVGEAPTAEVVVELPSTSISRVASGFNFLRSSVVDDT